MIIAMTSELHDSCDKARADLAALDDEWQTVNSCMSLLRTFTTAIRHPDLPHGEVFEMDGHTAAHIVVLHDTMVSISDYFSLEAIAPARIVVKAVDSTRRPV